MNDISGFQTVWASTFRSPSSRFLHEQQDQCRTGYRLLLHTQNLIARFTGIRTSAKSFLTSFLQPQGQLMRCVEICEEAIHFNPGNVIHELRIEERLG